MKKKLEISQMISLALIVAMTAWIAYKLGREQEEPRNINERNTANNAEVHLQFFIFVSYLLFMKNQFFSPAKAGFQSGQAAPLFPLTISTFVSCY